MTAKDEKASKRAAREEGLTWHGWVTQLIQKALQKRRDRIEREKA
jgi:hypothetical protein